MSTSRARFTTGKQGTHSHQPWPDIQCESDLSIYVYDAKSDALYLVVIHLVVNICMSLC